MTTQKLTIEPEWRALLPPLTDEERSELERSILAEGCRDPIVTWGSTIVDGHNRYDICSVRGLPFTVVPFYGGPDFDYLPSLSAKREAVKRWIIATQLGRRNLTDEQRELYIGMLYESKKSDPGQNLKRGTGKIVSLSTLVEAAEAAEAEEKNREISEISRTDNLSIRGNVRAEAGVTAAEEIAKECGISEKTVRRAGQFARGMEAIGKVDPALRGKILSGESRKVVAREAIRKLADAPAERVEEVVKAVAEGRSVNDLLRDTVAATDEPHKLEQAGSTPAPALSTVHAASRPEAVSFYADDFLSGTASMTLEQRGAYITLLCMQQTRGPLSMDDITAVTYGMASAKMVIKKFQLTDDGKYAQPRMEREVAVRRNFQLAQRERAEKRWSGNYNGDGNGGGDSECRGNAAALPARAGVVFNKSLGVDVKDVGVDVSGTEVVDTESVAAEKKTPTPQPAYPKIPTDMSAKFKPPAHLAEIWPHYIAARKKKRAVCTQYSLETIVAKLEKFAPGNHSAQCEILSKTIISGWTDVYQPKAKDAAARKELDFERKAEKKYADLERILKGGQSQ